MDVRWGMDGWVGGWGIGCLRGWVWGGCRECGGCGSDTGAVFTFPSSYYY